MVLLVLEFSQASTFTLVVMLAWEKLVHGIFRQVSVHVCYDSARPFIVSMLV